MEAVEGYVRKYTRKKKEVDTLFDWKLPQSHEYALDRQRVKIKKKLFLTIIRLRRICRIFMKKKIVVPTDKSPNCIVCLCAKDTILTVWLRKGLDKSLGNLTYPLSTKPKEDKINNHMSTLKSFGFSIGISIGDENMTRSPYYLLNTKTSQMSLQTQVYFLVCQLHD